MAMIRFVLVIAAGLLVADVAYAAPNTCMRSCNDITANVCNLKLPFDPSRNASPRCAPIHGKKSEVERAKRRLAIAAGSIQNAFMIAPAGLQKCLCSLKQIFITTDATYGSWGKWEGRGNGNSSIALYNPDLNNYATLPALLTERLTEIPVANGAGQYTDNNYANSGTLEVLYALAHEMGHMAFRRDYTNLSGCTLQSFLSTSWTDAANWSTWVKRPWTTYAESFGQRDPAIPSPKNASANDLKTIYQSTVVTALAAANPEEDFVETYAVEAINLATANNNYTLSIVIPAASGTPYPVNQGRSSLNPKSTCADSLLK
jgi:hypothetical protein